MAVFREGYESILQETKQYGATLVAVSKMQSVEDIRAMYDLGQRDFGENYVQELLEKRERLPEDIRWHFIGHLQTNKVKYIAPFIHLVHGIDSPKLLVELNRQAAKNKRRIPCLLQVHISKEDTKFGFDPRELQQVLDLIKNEPTTYEHVAIEGLMGMATFTEDNALIRSEFRQMTDIFRSLAASPPQPIPFHILSMGMSADYRMALEEGSTMIRVGSLLFGARSRKPA